MQSPYLEAQAKNGAQTPYLVHLLMDEAVPPDRARLVKKLRARLGRLEPVEAEGTALHFYLPDYVSNLEGQFIPLQLAVLALDGIGVDELAGCLRQSWTWPDAGEAASKCHAALTLSDFYGAGVDRRVRLALFHGALSALLEELPVRALEWLPSQQVISPDDYTERIRAGEGLAGSAVNVRRYRMESTEGAVHVLDTLGLRAFGLPDLQLRFTRMDPERVSQWLYQQAAALFDGGDHFLSRGHVRSVDGAEEWRWREDVSVTKPERAVLDIDAGTCAPPLA